jgi:hypothetical protein
VTRIPTAAFLLGACSVVPLGCSTRVEQAAVPASPAATGHAAPSQADFERDEETTRAEYSASSTTLSADPSATARSEVEAKQSAYFRAVERAMDYCRPQAELASRYFDETAHAIYVEANDACRQLGEEHIKAEVVAVIDGGTRVLVKAGAQDRGKPKPGRDRSFRSYATRYGDFRRHGLSHEEALVALEGGGAR